MSTILRLTRHVFEVGESLHRMEKNMVSIKENQEELIRLQKSQLDSEKPDCLLTAKEVCNLLNITPKTLWNWNQTGALPHVEIGGRKYYRESIVLKHKR
mgnify:FL=1